MTDNSTQRPATVKNTKLIKTGLLSQQQHHQQSGFLQKPSLLKQPLSSLNTNYILDSQNNNCNNNNHNFYYDQKHVHQKRQSLSHELKDLTEDALKNNVQIVLNNIQNALLNQQQQQQQNQQDYYQDQFQYLNIFNNHSPPTRSYNQQQVAINQLRNKTKKMSSSPADCDNTNNNNMGPTSILGCSFASDFTHDNSDYQWFVDYG